MSVGSATFDKSGTIRVEDIELINENARTVFSAKSIEIDLFLPAVVFGSLRPQEIKATEVEFFDFQGRLGPRKSLLKITSLCLRKKEALWQLEDGRVLFKDLPVVLVGSLPARSFDDAADEIESDFDYDFDRIFAEIVRLQDFVSRLKDPFLHIEVFPITAKGTGIKGSLTAERVELPFGVGLEKSVRLTGGAFYSADGLNPGLIRLKAENARIREDVVLVQPRVEIHPSSEFSFPAGLVGSQVRASASQISSPEISVSAAGISADIGPRFTTSIDAWFDLWGEPVSLSGELFPFRKKIQLNIEGSISVPDLLLHPAIPPEATLVEVDFGSGLYVSAQTEITTEKLIPDSIQFRAETGPASIQGFSAEHALFEGEFFPSTMTLSVDRLETQTENYHLSGTYSHDFRSNVFRLLIHGGFLPMDISGWMRDWWDKVWVDFDLREVPYIDLDLTGDWDYRDAREMFGGIRFRNISLRGMEIDRGFASMRSRPYLFELFDLEVFRPEGQASGGFANLLDWETRREYAKIYDFTSTLDLEKVAPLFGEEIEGIVSRFDLDAPPTLTVQGVLFPDIPGKDSPIDNLRIFASTDFPLTFSTIRLDNLAFRGVFQNDLLRIDPVDFGLGGGTGKAWIAYKTEQGAESPATAWLELKNANPAEVAQAIPKIKEAVADRFEPSGNVDPEDSNLDFTIEVSGDLQEPETLLGEGRIDLLTPNLANVRLFGIFSRIYEELSLPLSFGSFQFERVSSSFLLNKGLVEMPNMTLHSPSSRLLASGSYSMENETIDFDARMQLLGEVNFPILSQIGFLLSPLGKAFEFRLWGELDDLNWRLYMDPRSWN